MHARLTKQPLTKMATIVTQYNRNHIWRVSTLHRDCRDEFWKSYNSPNLQTVVFPSNGSQFKANLYPSWLHSWTAVFKLYCTNMSTPLTWVTQRSMARNWCFQELHIKHSFPQASNFVKFHQNMTCCNRLHIFNNTWVEDERAWYSTIFHNLRSTNIPESNTNAPSNVLPVNYALIQSRFFPDPNNFEFPSLPSEQDLQNRGWFHHTSHVPVRSIRAVKARQPQSPKLFASLTGFVNTRQEPAAATGGAPGGPGSEG